MRDKTPRQLPTLSLINGPKEESPRIHFDAYPFFHNEASPPNLSAIRRSQEEIKTLHPLIKEVTFKQQNPQDPTDAAEPQQILILRDSMNRRTIKHDTSRNRARPHPTATEVPDVVRDVSRQTALGGKL